MQIFWDVALCRWMFPNNSKKQSALSSRIERLYLGTKIFSTSDKHPSAIFILYTLSKADVSHKCANNCALYKVPNGQVSHFYFANTCTWINLPNVCLVTIITFPWQVPGHSTYRMIMTFHTQLTHLPVTY